MILHVNVQIMNLLRGLTICKKWISKSSCSVQDESISRCWEDWQFTKFDLTGLFLFFSGILRQVQDEYKIDDGQAGALQTAFVICYMLFAPLFGYFGDRHSRKMIMALGVLIWVAATLVGSFMPVKFIFLFGIEE